MVFVLSIPMGRSRGRGDRGRDLHGNTQVFIWLVIIHGMDPLREAIGLLMGPIAF